jgi:hypothetical protein
MRQPQQPSLYESLTQNFYTVRWLIQFPALTVMVWLRRDLGFRMVSPVRIVPVTVFLFVISVLASNGNPDNRLWGLLIFALLTLAIGICQHVKRWFELGQKVKQHSYFLGTSRLNNFRWIPDFLRHERRLERFADPIFCVLIGFAVLPLSHALGMWLVFSGFCLRAYEYSIYMRDRNLNLDILDGMIRSEQQNETVEEFETKSDWRKNDNSNGLPTGLGEDLESQITISLKTRKAKTNKNTIDI